MYFLYMSEYHLVFKYVEWFIAWILNDKNRK